MNTALTAILSATILASGVSNMSVVVLWVFAFQIWIIIEFRMSIGEKYIFYKQSQTTKIISPSRISRQRKGYKNT